MSLNNTPATCNTHKKEYRNYDELFHDYSPPSSNGEKSSGGTSPGRIAP